MDFLNPEEQSRIKIQRLADQPKPVPVVPAKPPLGAKPGQPLRPGVPGARPAPGAPGAKPAVPGQAPVSVAAVVKAKQPPKVQVNQVEPGIFEVHFTCSCGEQYVIRCDSATPPPAPGAENSSAPASPQ